MKKTIVFVNTKKRSDIVALRLSIYAGIKAWSINRYFLPLKKAIFSDRPMTLRAEALTAFEEDPESNVLVSTELMARGHNINNLHHVRIFIDKNF